jgi:hypothetical protein
VPANRQTNAAIAVVPGLAIGIAFIVMLAIIFNSTEVTFPEKYPGTIIVEGLSKQYHVGDELDLLVRMQGTVSSCSYPRAIVTNTDTSQVLWDSGVQIILCVVDGENDKRPIAVEWILGESYTENGATSLWDPVEKIIPAEAGSYSLTIMYDGLESTTPFTVYP